MLGRVGTPGCEGAARDALNAIALRTEHYAIANDGLIGADEAFINEMNARVSV
jgi:hypothetical protein